MAVLGSYGPYPGGVYYEGAAVAPSDLVPSVYPVAIAGHPYAVEWKFYKMAHLPMRRPAQDESREPGEATLSSAGPWPRSQSDWSLGAGQTWLDDEFVPSELTRRRFRQSLGIDVFNDRHIGLLPETEKKLATTEALTKVLTVDTRLYILDGTNVRFSDATSSEKHPQWTLNWTNATGLPAGPADQLDITFSGSHVYVLGSDNSIYRATPGTAAFALYFNPAAVVTRIWSALGRLFASDGRVLYEITATPGETTIFTHPDPNYVVSSLTACPTGVYFSGNIGSKGEVRYTKVNSAGTAFDPPAVAAEFINETVNALTTAGNNLLFGTSVGFRYAPIDNLASGLDFGPAVEIGSVKELVVDSFINPDGQLDTFAWGTWSNINSAGVNGLVRIRLTRQTETNVPAYASDIYTADAGTVSSVASIRGRRYFAIPTVGFYGGSANFVASGTLSTGRIRYGVLENKVFSDVKWRTSPLVGSVSAIVTFDDGGIADAGSQGVAGTIGNEFSSIGPVAAEWGEITFTLSRGGRTDNILLLGGGTDSATTPDHANFAITDLDVRIELSMTDWTPGGLGQFLIDQYPNVAGNNGWAFSVGATGTLILTWSTDGTNVKTATSSQITGFTDGSRHWVRCTLDVNDGAGGHDVAFYESADGITWSLIGTVQHNPGGAGTTSIFNSTGSVGIGNILPLIGKVYRARLLASIGGAEVANPDFTRQPVGTTSFADTASTPKTWTLNGSASIAAESSVTDWSPEFRWWRLRAIPGVEETMQFIVPLILTEKVVAIPGLGRSLGQDFLGELEFLMALSNSKQIVTYQEGRRSYSVYVNSLEVNPTRWNTMDQNVEGLVAVELHSVTHMAM